MSDYEGGGKPPLFELLVATLYVGFLTGAVAWLFWFMAAPRG